MRKPCAKIVRQLLRLHPDGLTRKQISDLTGIRLDVLTKTLKSMPDVYVDRWSPPAGWTVGNLVPVFCAVTVPEDCPKPEKRKNHETT